MLDDQGVDVDVVRCADDLDDAEVDEHTTVVVTSSEQLGASTVERLLARTDRATLVVVDPGPTLLELLGVTGPLGAVDTGGPVAADCDRALFADLELEVDDATADAGRGLLRRGDRRP